MNLESTDAWPFDQPKNCAVFTTRQVMTGLEPIVYVSHDEDDHGWQFIGSSAVSMADAMLVCLKNVVVLDPSVISVADLPPGWIAERDGVSDPWRRLKHPAVLEE